MTDLLHVPKFTRFIDGLLRTFLIALLLLVSACSESRKDRNVEVFVQKVEMKPMQPVKPYPDVKLLPTFTYPVMQRRDPFAAHKLERNDNQVAGPDRTRTKEELEKFPLDALKMVGILRGEGKLRVLMLAPDNIIYQVSVGSYVGQDFGRVTELTLDTMQLLETIRVSGNWEERPQTLKLAKKE